MRILLINPPFNRLKEIDTSSFPIGLGYIAAMLEKKGYYTRIYNANVGQETKEFKLYDPINRSRSHNKYVSALKNKDHYVWQEIKKVIEDFKPDVVGITTTSEMYGSSVKVANLSKEVFPEVPVVLGGVHCTICPDQVIKEKNVDIVVRGEGEYAMLEICNALKDKKSLDNIEGIAFKKAGEIITTPNREFIEDLDELPIPARHLLLHPEIPQSINVMLTTRGCPFDCTFCSSPFLWKRRLRQRKPENIIKEIKVLVDEFKVPHFRIWDDTFTANKENVIALCKLIIKAGIHKKVTWDISNRVDAINEETLKWLRKANCVKMGVGIEFGSEKMLKLSKKRITKDQIRKAAKLIRKNGFLFHSFWMMGFPEETKEDIKESIEFIKELKPDCALVNIVTPHPATELHDQLVKMGILTADYDWKQPLDPNIGFTKMPKEEFDAVAKEYFNTARYITERNPKAIMKKAWLYRRRLYKDPKKILKVVRDRILDKPFK